MPLGMGHGIWLGAIQRVALNTVMGIGFMNPLASSYISKHTPNKEWDGWGFDGGADYYGHGPNTGTLDDETYQDGTDTTRTVASIIWSESEFELFSLDGVSIANNDDTFKSIIVNGVEYLRSEATYDANQNGGTHWWWVETTRPHGTSGDVNFQVTL